MALRADLLIVYIFGTKLLSLSYLLACKIDASVYENDINIPY